MEPSLEAAGKKPTQSQRAIGGNNVRKKIIDLPDDKSLDSSLDGWGEKICIFFFCISFAGINFISLVSSWETNQSGGY